MKNAQILFGSGKAFLG